MQNNATNRFDNEELLHLALREMEASQTEKAISHLKDILDTEPKHAKANYLLGALYAELRMYDRSLMSMKAAVEDEPQLFIAHFQIGLLLATLARPEEAIEAWKPLEQLNENDPLLLFKTGLVHLIHDDFEQCVSFLSKGIQLNQINPALNNDMLKMQKQAEQIINNMHNQAGEQENDSEVTTKGKKMLLSAYQTEDDTNEQNH